MYHICVIDKTYTQSFCESRGTTSRILCKNHLFSLLFLFLFFFCFRSQSPVLLMSSDDRESRSVPRGSSQVSSSISVCQLKWSSIVITFKVCKIREWYSRNHPRIISVEGSLTFSFFFFCGR